MRASSAGTALASSPTALVSARGATADRDGVLVAGSVTLLGDGSVAQRPAVWRSPGPSGPWTRTDLPGDGALGEAHAASCDVSGTCTVLGVVDGTLRGWRLAPDGSVAALALPGLAVGEHDLLCAPLLRGGEATVLLASGGVLQVLTVSGERRAVARVRRRRQRRPARLVRSTARRHPAAGRAARAAGAARRRARHPARSSCSRTRPAARPASVRLDDA